MDFAQLAEQDFNTVFEINKRRECSLCKEISKGLSEWMYRDAAKLDDFHSRLNLRGYRFYVRVVSGETDRSKLLIELLSFSLWHNRVEKGVAWSKRIGDVSAQSIRLDFMEALKAIEEERNQKNDRSKRTKGSRNRRSFS